MKSAVIIDDEADAISILTSFLKKFCPKIHLLGSAQSMKEGVSLIENTEPDLLFLDIQLPDGTGFQLLERLNQPNVKVIFITAYDQYAIKAFRYAATDYLLKPINPEELMEAVQKAEKNHVLKNRQIEQLNQGYQNSQFETIAIPSIDEYLFVKIQDISCCEADGNYTKIFLTNKEQPILVTLPLKEYSELLPSSSFFRVHQSYLVNLNYIDRFIKSDGGYIYMKSGKMVPVSRRKKPAFLQRLGIK